jgi:hypothetical protein
MGAWLGPAAAAPGGVAAHRGEWIPSASLRSQQAAPASPPLPEYTTAADYSDASSPVRTLAMMSR